MLIRKILCRIILITIIFVFIFNIFGYYIIYIALQLDIKRKIEYDIKKGFLNNTLTLLIIPKKNISKIHWIEYFKELKYKGEMYDIVKVEKIENKLCLYCFCDKKERKIISNYLKTHSAKNSSNKRNKKIDGIKLFFYTNSLKVNLFDKNIFNNNTCFNVSDVIILIPSPPPKKA